MTFLRRARLAGELVARGMCLVFFHRAVRVVNDPVPRSVKYPGELGTGVRIVAGRVLAEGKQFHDAGDHGLIDLAVFAELALALRAFARREVAQAGFPTHDFARSGDFEPFGRGLLRLATCDRLWHWERGS